MYVIRSTGRYTDFTRESLPMSATRARRMLASLRSACTNRTYELRQVSADALSPAALYYDGRL